MLAVNMRMLVEDLGYESKPAYTGAEALQAVADFIPHVVLLDIGLPDISGLKVARQLRETPHGKKLGICALTGWGRRRMYGAAKEPGECHFTKPLHSDELAASLRGVEAVLNA